MLFAKIKKIKFSNLQGGMTYLELIVVLSIFSVMTSVVLFDYNTFEDNINVKVLANDIALKLVESQKSAVGGKVAVGAPLGWSPSYGLYFQATTPKSFIYFADLNNDQIFNGTVCTVECLEQITITKDNSISAIKPIGLSGGNMCPATVSDLYVVFKRPDSSAIMKSSTNLGGCTIDYYDIDISSANTFKSKVRIYPSGRIEIK